MTTAAKKRPTRADVEKLERQADAYREILAEADKRFEATQSECAELRLVVREQGGTIATLDAQLRVNNRQQRRSGVGMVAAQAPRNLVAEEPAKRPR